MVAKKYREYLRSASELLHLKYVLVITKNFLISLLYYLETIFV
jgi:hypothetical protein